MHSVNAGLHRSRTEHGSGFKRSITRPEPAAEAIAFDADTPHRLPQQPNSPSANSATGAGARVRYKKIDSTLRGNFAIEIAAARNASASVSAT